MQMEVPRGTSNSALARESFEIGIELEDDAAVLPLSAVRDVFDLRLVVDLVAKDVAPERAVLEREPGAFDAPASGVSARAPILEPDRLYVGPVAPQLEPLDAARPRTAPLADEVLRLPVKRGAAGQKAERREQDRSRPYQEVMQPQ